MPRSFFRVARESTWGRVCRDITDFNLNSQQKARVGKNEEHRFNHGAALQHFDATQFHDLANKAQ